MPPIINSEQTRLHGGSKNFFIDVTGTGERIVNRTLNVLVTSLAELDRSRLDGPIQLADIHQSLVPYRTHRGVLGVETNQDYEMVVLRFLSGERGYARVEPEEIEEPEREAVLQD